MRAFNDLKLLGKLALPSLILILVAVGLVVLARASLATLAQNTTQIVDVRATRLSVAQQLALAVDEAVIAEKNTIIETDAALMQQDFAHYQASRKAALEANDRLIALADTRGTPGNPAGRPQRPRGVLRRRRPLHRPRPAQRERSGRPDLEAGGPPGPAQDRPERGDPRRLEPARPRDRQAGSDRDGRERHAHPHRHRHPAVSASRSACSRSSPSTASPARSPP